MKLSATVFGEARSGILRILVVSAIFCWVECGELYALEVSPGADGASTQTIVESGPTADGGITAKPTQSSRFAELAANELVWLDNYENALAQAHKRGRPVLIDFTAPWCSACKKMDATTLRSAALQSELAEYTLVKVDYDQDAALVAKYRVRGIPAYVILNQFGEYVAATTGYSEPEQFHNWLTTYAMKAMASVSMAENTEAILAHWDMDLRSSDQVTRVRAMERVLGLYLDQEQPENIRDIARSHLKSFVQDDPVYAFNYVDDDRLAVRILFANLFLEKLGAEFVYDPWDTAEARRPVITEWARKLQAK